MGFIAFLDRSTQQLMDAVKRPANKGDAAAVTAHLDTGVVLLDACNAITARLDRLRRRHLLSWFTLHLFSSGRLSGAASVLLTVDAVSSLAAAATAAVLYGEALQIVFPLLAALATKAGEVDAVDEAVRKLTSVLDSESDLDEAALRVAA
ncbi:hypothetical protein E2562_014669 [Oryza meyeriana var. granulata]|uniref:Uncharacterized protein n=1 Tax=Oryza meyeriana var. granulata TaxID=110450 RepID=A0A6G1D3U3_9ORYZ|nr:hypothetical protein E2562_014669 [Oryza meyeriana var. granulata]